MKIHTFGCKVNQAESKQIEEQFFEYENKNIIVINTCTITQKADAKCRNLINRTIKNNPDKIIVVTGCMAEQILRPAQNDTSTLLSVPSKDNIIFLKNKDKLNIPQILNLQKIKTTKKYQPSKTRAFLKIQDGCDSFCSYCIVPYVRSQKWSMDFKEINKEINKIYKQGFKEIVLTGTRIGFYNYNGHTFSDVLKLVLENKNTHRIRISSIEPTEITDEIIQTIAQNQYSIKTSRGICPHLHIAFQSGSNKILNDMKRGYDTNYLKNLVKKLRKNIKDLRITIDLIIGYPTETDNDFENTIKLLEDLKIDGIHYFTFSKRKGTDAYNLKEKIPNHIIKQRKEIIKNLDLKLRIQSAEKFLNKKTEILLEDDGGYTPNYIKVKLFNKKDPSDYLRMTKRQNQFVKIIPNKIIKDWPVWME